MIVSGGDGTVYVAAYTGQISNDGRSRAADYDARCRGQTFRNIEKTLSEADAKLSAWYGVSDR